MEAVQLKMVYQLDKLEQLRKSPKNKGSSEQSQLEMLNKRAAAKFSQQPLVEALINLNNEYKEKYINTLYCASTLIQNGNKLQSRYCKNRWCKVCNRIRTAKLINGYAPALDKLQNKYFVTLTLPNVEAELLRATIKKMLKGIRDIQELWRKNKESKIKGIRKLECTYNPDLNNYHPHFHFIVDGEEAAQKLVNCWLDRFKNAVSWAQNYKPCYDYKELFKYFTKTAAKSQINEDEYFYPQALHIIYKSIENIRIVQPMGGIKMVSDEIEEIETQIIEEIEEKETQYSYEYDNYTDINTGEYLTKYVPTKKTLLYRNKIRYLEDKNITFEQFEEEKRLERQRLFDELCINFNDFFDT